MRTPTGRIAAASFATAVFAGCAGGIGRTGSPSGVDTHPAGEPRNVAAQQGGENDRGHVTSDNPLDGQLKVCPSSPAEACPTESGARVRSFDLLDTSGAIELAVRYVASTDGVMAHSPIGRRAILSRLVEPSVLDEHVDATEAAAAALATSLRRPVDELIWVEAPVSAEVVETTDSGVVTVGVWSVSMSAFPNQAPQEVWRTVIVTLMDDGSRWCVTSARAEAGPTPITADLALPADWESYRRVASWTPVVAGDDL